MRNLPSLQKSHELVKIDDLHKPIAQGLAALDGQTDQGIAALTEQYEVLHRQAAAIFERRRISSRIYEADFGFNPIIQGEYHLYVRENGKAFVSMVGPLEWGKSRRAAFAHVARIKLDYDHTWQVLDLSMPDHFLET